MQIILHLYKIYIYIIFTILSLLFHLFIPLLEKKGENTVELAYMHIFFSLPNDVHIRADFTVS